MIQNRQRKIQDLKSAVEMSKVSLILTPFMSIQQLALHLRNSYQKFHKHSSNSESPRYEVSIMFWAFLRQQEDCGERAANELLAHVDDPLERFPLSHYAASEPYA